MALGFLSGLFKKSETSQRPTGVAPLVLVVMDGWGIAPASNGNAITLAKTPVINQLYSLYPHGELNASGEAVGLPANEEGNTEVGHINLGAGRVVFQDLKKISRAIEDGTFYDNRVFNQALGHAKKYSSKLHILGLVGSGQVHSSMDHFWALLTLCQKAKAEKVYLHLITDGRDSPPKDALNVVAQIEKKLKDLNFGAVATVSGRYWAMDRDRRWERTQKAYEAMVEGKGQVAASASQAVQNAYNANLTDEFIEPTVIVAPGKTPVTVDDNDAAIFFNFRIDRPRQLTMAFTIPNFESLRSFEFGTDPEKGGRKEGEVKFDSTFLRQKKPQNLFFVTMTEYQKGLPVSGIAFPPEIVEECLAQYLSGKGLKQMHLAESEKERFVTYYFDGLREERFQGEEALIVLSPKVPTYDKKPEMSLPKLTEEFGKTVMEGKYHFILVNIANPDMVAHSGNLKATVTAIEAVDKYLGGMVRTVLAVGGTLVITADHGNAEELITYPSSGYFFSTGEGKVNTEHSSSPVPILVVNQGLQGRASGNLRGKLADVAPTILNLMKLAVPEKMTGKNLLGGENETTKT